MKATTNSKPRRREVAQGRHMKLSFQKVASYIYENLEQGSKMCDVMGVLVVLVVVVVKIHLTWVRIVEHDVIFGKPDMLISKP